MKKVFIDAGHGGKDPGAVGNGIKEKDIALAVSLGIKQRLESQYDGVSVTLSRSTDTFLELRERTNQANKLGADALVSIHCNAGGGAGGFESFRYTTASKASIALQNILHVEIVNRLKPFGVIDRGTKSKNLHMVRESKMTAVLTENLFIDVLSDANRLKRAEIINAIIDGHVSGLAKHLGLQPKPATKSDNQVNVTVKGKTVAGVKLIDGVSYVPLRAITDALGVKIDWDAKTKTATII
jgi:N-acetylmuramoyl-L-alanine amidase